MAKKSKGQATSKRGRMAALVGERGAARIDDRSVGVSDMIIGAEAIDKAIVQAVVSSGAVEQAPYILSVVIPAYNCGAYLEEAILSVVEQDIGFADNVQLILVDDGSTDATPDICERYARLFPENVVHLRQPNCGAAAARLAGLALSRGVYVNFLDADDMWDLDAFSTMLAFLRAHSDVAVCAARHRFFGAQVGEHSLGYKFTRDAVIDLRQTYDFPQLSLSNALVRRDLLNPAYFDGRLQVSEDFLVINRVLLSQMRYGVVSGPTYWYRKREAGDSAIDQSARNPSWYMDVPRLCYRTLFDECCALYGEVLPHLQFAVMYDLQWRLKRPLPHPLGEEDLQCYRNLLLGLLAEIDDSIVVQQRNLDPAEKVYVLGLKYGKTFEQMQHTLAVKPDGLFCDECSIAEAKAATPGASPDQAFSIVSATRAANQLHICGLRQQDQDLVHIDFISREGNELVFEGWLGCCLASDDMGLAAETGSWRRTARLEERPDKRRDAFFDRGYHHAIGFVLRVPCDRTNELMKFTLELGSCQVPARLRSGRFCPISFQPLDYAVFGDRALRSIGTAKDRLAITRAGIAGLAVEEALLEAGIWIVRPNARRLLKSRRKALVRRALQKGTSSVGNARIWLISDRPNLAGDNGEALFTYLAEHPITGVQPVFVLAQDSPDFGRLSAIGPTVPFGTDEHAALQLVADKIISASADETMIDRFARFRFLAKGVQRRCFVFLQHGVTQNDVSRWLNRYEKDIALFVCASVCERESILGNPAYGYGPDQVVLTGFPRHDYLERQAADTQVQRKVLITPTWRQNLVMSQDPATGARHMSPAFEESAYFAFNRALLNSPELQDAVQQLDYQVSFLLHPAFAEAAELFDSPFADVLTEYDYRREMCESAIMVTDYSSVAFDFALLRKPVLYAQFDADTFYLDHPWEPGYFDYGRDGFGPVTRTLDETVRTLIALMESPEMPIEYRGRADSFFFEPPDGTSRCEMVLEAINRLDLLNG